MKCRHLLKIDRAYKLYAKDTTEKIKTDLKLYDIEMVIAKIRGRKTIQSPPRN